MSGRYADPVTDGGLLGSDGPAPDKHDAGVARRSNRGFWIVLGTIALACVVLLAEIFANRPIGNAIGTAEHDLRVAQAAAETEGAQTGTFLGADAAGLNVQHLDGGRLVAVG